MKFKLLGNSGLRVSELALGTMTFGKDWGWGADQEESRKIFEAYAKAGGNFIDTANRYTEGSSERFVGEFIKEDRDHFVLATKYSLYDRLDDVSFTGNSRKNMMRSVEASLKRLQTDYIDVLWLHAWDFMTPVEEIMRGLDDLVSSGKVNYIGISDTPAWIVSRANTMAELRGWSRFIGIQAEYNLLQRTPERDLIPMAKALGLGLTAWGPLAGGALTGKYLKGETGRVSEDSERRSARSNDIVQKVLDIGEKMSVSPAQLAQRWIMQRDFTSIPLIGGRKLSQVEDSLKCVDLVISDQMMEELNEISKIKLGFPHDFLNQDGVKQVLYGGMRDKIVF